MLGRRATSIRLSRRQSGAGGPPAKTPGRRNFPTGNLSGNKNQQTPRVAGGQQ